MCNTRKTGAKKFPCCHGNIVPPGDIAFIVTGASFFTTTGEMKNSQFSFSTSQPLYMNLLSIAPLPSLLYLSSISPHLLLAAPILGRWQTSMPVSCSLKESPNTNSEKLFIVQHRRLPPGVLVSQKALQMQWGISFLRFCLFFLPNTEEMHANMSCR